MPLGGPAKTWIEHTERPACVNFAWSWSPWRAQPADRGNQRVLTPADCLLRPTIVAVSLRMVEVVEIFCCRNTHGDRGSDLRRMRSD